MKQITMFFSIFLVIFTSAISAPVNFWFEQANTLYEKQNYDSSALLYEKIISTGMSNSAVYFNLGNSYFRLKKVGLSLLNYEKALKLSPNDPDILANIAYANSAIIDRIPAPQQSFIATLLQKLHNILSLQTQLWVLFGLLFVLSIFFVLFLYVSPNTRLWLMYISTLLILATLSLGISAGVKIYSSEKISHAIVLSPTLDAKNQPNGTVVLFTVHEGTKFRIRKAIGDWVLVSLPTGVSGWVQSSSLGKI